MANISHEQMVLMLLTRVSALVDWLFIAISHLALAGLAIWLWQLSPADVAGSVQRLAQSQPAALLGLAGVSGATVLALWLRACFLVTRKLTTRYVWRPVHAAMRD